jgi:hypothetical protein
VPQYPSLQADPPNADPQPVLSSDLSFDDRLKQLKREGEALKKV